MDERRAYPSDLTEAEWEILEPFIPEVSEEATVPTISRREIESAHSLRLAQRLPVEVDAPRFACLGHGVLLLPDVAHRRHLG